MGIKKIELNGCFVLLAVMLLIVRCYDNKAILFLFWKPLIYHSSKPQQQKRKKKKIKIKI